MVHAMKSDDGQKQLYSGALEFVKIQEAKKKIGNLGLCGSAIAGLLITANYMAFDYLFSPIAFFFFTLLSCALFASILNYFIVRAVDEAFKKHFKESDLPASGNPELYKELLAMFAAELNCREEEVIADPFLRGVLNRVYLCPSEYDFR